MEVRCTSKTVSVTKREVWYFNVLSPNDAEQSTQSGVVRLLAKAPTPVIQAPGPSVVCYASSSLAFRFPRCKGKVPPKTTVLL